MGTSNREKPLAAVDPPDKECAAGHEPEWRRPALDRVGEDGEAEEEGDGKTDAPTRAGQLAEGEPERSDEAGQPAIPKVVADELVPQMSRLTGSDVPDRVGGEVDAVPLCIEDGREPEQQPDATRCGDRRECSSSTADNHVGQDQVDPVRPARLPARNAANAAQWFEQDASVVTDDHPNRESEQPASGVGGLEAHAKTVAGHLAQRRTGTTPYVAPRSVRLSSPERVLFPDEGITKEDLFEYYRAIAPVLVPHLRNRPFTMKRSPYGVGGEAYFQKQAPKGMPSWIPTRTYRTYPRGRKGESRMVDFPLVNSPEAVLWMVQMNCIDMNAWYSRVDKPDRPDFVLFDLDPPDGGFALAIRVAHLIREELERLELQSYVKTSGADGIHVLVPIARRATYEQTYEFAELVARGLEERHPGLVTTEWLKHKREGVLVDHRQNARGKTIASVYSVRPKPGAPVSTPLRWDELTEDVTPRRYGMREALARVEQHGDLFEPVLAGGQALGRALKKVS